MINASQIISTNTQEVVAAVGVESLSNVPFLLRRKEKKLGNICVPDIILHDGLLDFFEQEDVTCFAEITAQENGICRKDQDEYGIQSFNKANCAVKERIFEKEIVPVVLKSKSTTSLKWHLSPYNFLMTKSIR